MITAKLARHINRYAKKRSRQARIRQILQSIENAAIDGKTEFVANYHHISSKEIAILKRLGFSVEQPLSPLGVRIFW